MIEHYSVSIRLTIVANLSEECGMLLFPKHKCVHVDGLHHLQLWLVLVEYPLPVYLLNRNGLAI